MGSREGGNHLRGALDLEPHLLDLLLRRCELDLDRLELRREHNRRFAKEGGENVGGARRTARCREGTVCVCVCVCTCGRPEDEGGGEGAERRGTLSSFSATSGSAAEADAASCIARLAVSMSETACLAAARPAAPTMETTCAHAARPTRLSGSSLRRRSVARSRGSAAAAIHKNTRDGFRRVSAGKGHMPTSRGSAQVGWEGMGGKAAHGC